MVDIHSHILNGVDDGSKTIEESIQILKEAVNAGVTDIIVTPHYVPEGNYINNVKENRAYLEELIKETIKQKIDIRLYQGNEVYVTRNIEELIFSEEIATLNRSRYVLFELPMAQNIPYLNDVIYSLLGENLIPIIAHPERYTFYQKDQSQMVELIEKGVLFQANLGSIIGLYGKDAKKALIQMLKTDKIHFLASDVHRFGTIYPKMNEIIEELKKYISKEKIEELTQIHANLVLQNEDIDIENPLRVEEKKGLFSFFSAFGKNN